MCLLRGMLKMFVLFLLYIGHDSLLGVVAQQHEGQMQFQVGQLEEEKVVNNPAEGKHLLNSYTRQIPVEIKSIDGAGPLKINVPSPVGHFSNQLNQPGSKQVNEKSDSSSALIADSKECSQDVEHVCSGKLIKSNLDVLNCIADAREDEESVLSEACHQYIWSYKLNVTTDPRFNIIARQVCQKALITFDNCAKYPDVDGKLISCLLDHQDSIEVDICNQFLSKIQIVMFSDYRLICDFTRYCEKDIKRLQCGKAYTLKENMGSVNVAHSQGSVVACLEEAFHDVSDQCQHQIRRLAELQASDYHLDRHLYFECRDDREKLCGNIEAGEGRVYKCLFNNKLHSLMSSGCRDALTSRQQLVMSQDYKASYGLSEACADDILKGQCIEHASNISSNEDVIGLSSVMLCLEDQKYSGVPLSQNCEEQLVDFRRMLLEDYEILPEITDKCSDEIKRHCDGSLKKEGGTIHCLLGAAQLEGGLSPPCQKELLNLIKESEVASDYRMDPVLLRACDPVIQSSCSSYEGGDPMVLSCLMDHLHSKEMLKSCKSRLVEVQYFVSRDFFLDPIFHDKCKDDSKKLCSMDLGKIAGTDGDSESFTMPFSLVMSCLYSHIRSYEIKDDDNTQVDLSTGCEEEVRRLLRQRALDVKLNPDLEEVCRYDLGDKCSDEMVSEEGKELICLQDHYDQLKEKCKKKIVTLTQLEGAEAEDLDNVLINACEPMLQEFCKSFLEKADQGRVMQCLIDNKERMSNAECVAGITHFQLIEMKDYYFSLKFLKACKEDVDKHCSMTELKTKGDVVNCLSMEIRNAVLRHTESTISMACMQEVNVDKLTMHKDITLNSELNKHCEEDYQKLCDHVKSGSARIIECLREKHDELTPACYEHLYEFEKEESLDPDLDFVLTRLCKKEWKSLCESQSHNSQDAFQCLLHHKMDLSTHCLEVVIQREREMFSDVSLNVELEDSCKTDIKKFCKNEFDKAVELHKTGQDPHGIIYTCLKAQYRDNQDLTPACYEHMIFVMKEQEMNYMLDPKLTVACLDAITTICHPEQGNVVECLKAAYANGHLTRKPACMLEVASLIVEGKHDILADPVLKEACAKDLVTHCHKIPEGHGRLISCLLRTSDADKSQISYECYEELMKRRVMWDEAAKLKIGGLMDVSNEIVNSVNSSYIITVLFLITMSVLIAGTICGRFCKRVRRERRLL